MKYILLFFMLILLPIHAKADQLYVLTYEQATSAKKFLENEEYIIQYCGCCTDSVKEYIKIKNVNIEKYPNSFDGKQYYTIKVSGVDPITNKTREEFLDLAYTYFIRSDQKAYNVAIALLFDADLCMVDTFEVDPRIKTNKKFIEKEAYYRKFSERI